MQMKIISTMREDYAVLLATWLIKKHYWFQYNVETHAFRHMLKMAAGVNPPAALVSNAMITLREEKTT
jgi:hypothetical protein